MSLQTLLLDAASELLLLLDADNLDIVAANATAHRVLGYAPDALLGRNISELECALTDLFFWDEMRSSAKPLQAPGSFMHAQGHTIEVTKTVQRVGAAGQHFALCAQVLAPASELSTDAADLSSHLKATLEATADGILLTDNDGAILNMNRRFAELWNLPQQLLIERNDSGIVAHIDHQLVHAADAQTGQQLHHHAAGLTGTPDADTFDVLQLKDGRVIECISHPARDWERVIGRVFCYRDVTERKLHEQSLQEARERAEAATQSKGQFLANMSHEIRTPMNAILGLLTLLQKTELSARQKDYVSKTEGAAQSLLGLLNDILDFSKIDAGKMTLDPQPFRLAQLLDNLSVILSANIGAKPVDLRWNIDPRIPPTLVGDALRLQQVLINLGGNAVKFTARGEVAIQIQVLQQDNDEYALRFSVRDSGIGIAPENQKHIFDGFSQAEASTTRRFGGTGLGLSICKRLVGLMGGELSLHSELNRGSEFYFTITLPGMSTSELPAEDPHARDLPRAGRRLQGLRLLVVEDNPINQQVARELLRAEGAHVELADNGQLGVDAIAAMEPPFDVVLMDLQMPVMDGYTATQVIRHDLGLRDLPIVAMTANAMESDREACLAAGMNDHIGKPFDLNQLIRLLRLLGGLHHHSDAAHATEDPAETAPAAADAAQPALPESVAQAIERMGGDTGLYAAILDAYLQELETQPDLVEAALKTQDHTAVVRLLHTFKGLSNTVGALPMAELAAQAEQACKDDPQSLDPVTLCQQLHDCAASTLTILQPIARRLSGEAS